MCSRAFHDTDVTSMGLFEHVFTYVDLNLSLDIPFMRSSEGLLGINIVQVLHGFYSLCNDKRHEKASSTYSSHLRISTFS
ncbi:CLUMA_CG005277, isoform A [Clunio marinus]|uniref:CLUMA_CG005277, isoform A n=1 Tax=Clunio marinus TaxID=568069 RepID=A0A1J1HU72_9DIPT|nr:CLUMA_CG005277, isoform A [Clunio marinus]